MRCRGEGVKEGHEEREVTWERKREVEMKEWQLGTIMYIDDRQEMRTEPILPFLDVYCSPRDCPACQL